MRLQVLNRQIKIKINNIKTQVKDYIRKRFVPLDDNLRTEDSEDPEDPEDPEDECLLYIEDGPGNFERCVKFARIILNIFQKYGWSLF